MAQSAKDYFRQGIVASKQGNHTEALTAFEQAKAKGLDSAALHYNLGVSYFRLGRYQEAEQAFLRLVDHTSLGWHKPRIKTYAN